MYPTSDTSLRIGKMEFAPVLKMSLLETESEITSEGFASALRVIVATTKLFCSEVTALPSTQVINRIYPTP